MTAFLFALMLGTMLVGVPILLAIALVGYVGVAAVPDLVMPLFAQKMFAQLDSFTLLALPYFILAGGLMSASGMSQQLVDFSRVLVGHLRAGLAHASVVAAMIFAGISGSSTADASAISAIVIPTMKKSGYKAGFAAALIATAGTIGAIIPPSMVMVVYGAIAQVSIGGLFLAGIIPGILVGLALMATIKIYTWHPDYPELRVVHGRFEWSALGRSFREVWPALLGPVIIIGGILSGIFTATEAGAVACLYALLLGTLYYRKIKLRDLPGILVESAVMTTMVSGVIAVAGASGWLLAYLEFNVGAVKFVTSFSQDPTHGAADRRGGDDRAGHLRRLARGAADLRAGGDPDQQGLRHRPIPDGPGDGDVQPDRRRVASDRATAVRDHQHRADHLLRGEPPRLVVHARRDPGTVARDLHPWPGIVDTALLSRLASRAERRAAPKAARNPTGDRSMYPSTEGLQ